MFINRSWERTENDDFKLNVEDRIGRYSEAVPLIVDGVVLGWKIQRRYE